MPRDFVPTPGDNQLLRNLCEQAGVNVPTAVRVKAEREDVHDEIRKAQDNGDTERVTALKTANADLLNEDREAVLEPKIRELRTQAEEGDTAAGREAARLQRELDEWRRHNVVDDEVQDTDPSDDDGKGVKS